MPLWALLVKETLFGGAVLFSMNLRVAVFVASRRAYFPTRMRLLVTRTKKGSLRLDHVYMAMNAMYVLLHTYVVLRKWWDDDEANGGGREAAVIR